MLFASEKICRSNISYLLQPENPPFTGIEGDGFEIAGAGDELLLGVNIPQSVMAAQIGLHRDVPVVIRAAVDQD